MKGLSKLGLITVLTFAGGQNAAWAAKVIKGVVRSSDDKELLIGANVFVPTSELKRVGSKQTTLGTATDINGAFSLNVPDGVKKLMYAILVTRNILLTCKMASRYTM